MKEDAIESLLEFILPKATVLTPNVPELEILAGREIENIDDLKKSAELVGKKYNTACAAKGGHLFEQQNGNDSIIDVLYHNGEITEFSGPRTESNNTHGTGCRFSAALTALLALQKPLPEAVKGAKEYVARNLRPSQYCA